MVEVYMSLSMSMCKGLITSNNNKDSNKSKNNNKSSNSKNNKSSKKTK